MINNIPKNEDLYLQLKHHQEIVSQGKASKQVSTLLAEGRQTPL